MQIAECTFWLLNKTEVMHLAHDRKTSLKSTFIENAYIYDKLGKLGEMCKRKQILASQMHIAVVGL